MRPTYSDVLAEKISFARQFFGDDIDVSEQTPLGKYMRIEAFTQAAIYEDVEDVYYSRSPVTARGISLDRLCPFAGIIRNPPTASIHEIEITGTPGEVVQSGFLVSTESGILFHTISDAKIKMDGMVNTQVECELLGTMGNVSIGEINIIVNPSAIVESIRHIGIIKYAVDRESDANLRTRLLATVQGAGAANINAIRAAVQRVPTVINVDVVENATDETDDGGRPPRTFECYVFGGEDHHTEIAQAIFDKRPIGIRSYGDIIVPIFDDGGFSHDVRFSHTQSIDIRLRITIVADNTLGSSAENDIKDRLVARINYLGAGGSLFLSSLFELIHAERGVVDVTILEVSTDNGATYTTSSVICNPWQNVHIDIANIALAVIRP